MKYSFIVPVYNVHDYMRECIDSILNQTYKGFEIILVDDGSTDGSEKICDRYASEYLNITCIHQKNQGLSAARNTGIRTARGEYLIFVDSDDKWLKKDALENLNHYCDNIDCVVFNWCEFQNSLKRADVGEFNFNNIGNGVVSGETFLKSVLNEKKIFPWYVWIYCFQREWWINNGFQFQEGLLYEDIRITYYLMRKIRKLCIFDQVIYGYRTARQGSICRQITKSSMQDKLFATIQNIKEIEKDELLDHNLKSALLDNFSCGYYSILILTNVMSLRDKKWMLELLQKYRWICNYTKRQPQKKVAVLIKIFGVKSVGKLLGLRRMIKYGNGV